MAFCGFAFWTFAGWIGSWFNEGARGVGHWVGISAALGLGIYLTMLVGREMARKARRAVPGAEYGMVEEMHVTTGRVMVLQSDHSSMDPAVCFDLGEGRLLLLVGQWMCGPKKFGVPRGEALEASDEIQETVPNGLPPPWSFPSESFVLRRLAASGDVLSIRVKGVFVKPEQGSATLVAAEGRGYMESMILTGSLDDVEEALKQVPVEE